MSSESGVIDLTDEIPSNKRQRLEAGTGEGLSSSSFSGSLCQTTGTRDSLPGPSPAKKLGGRRSTKKQRPSPELDSNLFELGTVRLPCEVVQRDQQAKTSIHSLAARICPYGFATKPDGSPEKHGDSLCMDNLFERKLRGWNLTGSLYDSTHIKLDPWPLPEDVKRPRLPRLQAVTIFYSNGSQAPFTIGISTTWDASYAQLADAICKQCTISQDQHIELVHLRRNLWDGIMSKEQIVSCPQYYRRPSNNTSVPHARPILPSPDWFGGTSSSSSEDEDDESNWVGNGIDTHCRLVAYILPSRKNNRDLERVMVYTNTDALPMMFHVKSQWLLGGVEAEKHLRAAILQSLSPAAKPGKHGVLPFELYHSEARRHNTAMRFTTRSNDMWFGDCAFVHALFTQEALEEAYDMKVLAEPLAHESANEDAILESANCKKEVWEYKRASAKAAAEPWELVDEIYTASRTTRYPSGQEWATIQVAVSVEPASEAPDETRGHAVLKVWCWKNGQLPIPGAQRLLQDIDDWVTLASMREEFYLHIIVRLKHFMTMLCQGQADFDRMQADIKKWAAADEQKLRTLPGLMQLLQADERPEAEEPAGLSVELRPYQRQSLRFMLDVEQTEGGFRSMLYHKVTNGKGELYWHSPILGRISEHVPPMPQGGILGEEMGLGKTVEIAALVLSNPASPLQPDQTTTDKGHLVSRATLVVCPVSLMGQWADELADKAKGNLKVLLHHGPKRTKDPADLVDYDIVLVTYQTLGLEYSKAQKEGSFKDFDATEDCFFPPCGAIQWHRVVLDESHTVKNPNAQLTRACTALVSGKRWCVTGTPVGSDISDLKGQFNFLRMQPFTNKNFFARHVKLSYSGSSWARAPAGILLFMLSQCMIRHTKLQVLGGEEVLQLPNKTEELVPVNFNATEQELYMHVFKRAKAKYQMFRRYGPHEVSKKLLQIMSTLLPLRRICSGGKLSDKDLKIDLSENPGRMEPAVDQNAVCTEDACCICLESPIREPTRTPCNHWYCWECIAAILQSGAGNQTSLACPLCRAKVQTQKLVKGVNDGAAALEEEDSFTAKLEQKASMSDSKLKALLEELRVMRERDPKAKALVFSQFVSTLDWLKVRLEEQGFGYRTISGSMTLKRRAQAIEAFQKDPPTTVFLLSMRSGSVGINLTSANYMFLLEPALNPALEEQAIGRAWRMGQKREVHVKKLYIKGSVEERIMEMVKHRMEGTSNGQPSSSTPVPWPPAEYSFVRPMGLGRNQVKAQDIAGSMKADKQNLKMEELDLLFQSPSFSAAE